MNEREEDENPEVNPARRRRSKSSQQRREEKTEFRGCFLVGVATLVVVALVQWVIFFENDSPKVEHSAAPVKELTAEEVARAFISETDQEKRLKFVRDPEVVREHYRRYSVEALSECGVELRQMGSVKTYGEVAKSSYAVSFVSGKLRLLNVLDTDDGPKVDWDSYARYCSETWADLTAKESSASAEVRVFVLPGSHYVGDYVDQNKWVCFMLETPDSKEKLYAYGRVGEDVTTRMKDAVLRAKNYRQHMTLEVEAKGKQDSASLFEVKELLAVGWIE